MKRKAVSLVLALTMVASVVAGCGSKQEEATTEPAATEDAAAEKTDAADTADAAAEAVDGDLADKKVGSVPSCRAIWRARDSKLRTLKS